ncbi:MAG: VCBS repeat-containing protein [Planctomycetes bacterium]|nr:VCBS repeat-containing protein [Planctomycetota bacterium]
MPSAHLPARRLPMRCGAVAVLLVSLAATAPAQQFVTDVLPLSRSFLPPFDLDADGLPDLVSIGDGRIEWHRNLDHGRFAAGAPIAAANASLIHARGDFDGDGRIDLACFEYASTTGMPIDLVTSPNGVFQNTTIAQIPAGSRFGMFLAAVDFDSDGDLDLVGAWTDFVASSSLALRNDGNLVFTDVTSTRLAGIQFGAQIQPDVVVTDVDGDGLSDLLVHDGGLRLLRNQGAAFVDESAQRLPGLTAWASPAAADLDGDGDPDLLVVDTTSGLLFLENQNGVYAIAPGRVPGSLQLSGGLTALADIDGDGDRDVLALTSATSDVVALINDGTGHFAAGAAQPAFQLLSYSRLFLTAADLEGDGDVDLFLSAQGAEVMLGDGRGHLRRRPRDAELGSSVGLAADVDGDGDGDLVASATTLRNERNSRWSTLAGIGSTPRSPLQFGDCDGDGDIDIVAAQLLRNDGTGAFLADPLSGYAPQFALATAFCDVDGDGDLDILACQDLPPNGGIVLHLNNGTGVFGTGVPLATTVFCLYLDTGDIDGDGDPDVLASPTSGSPLLLRNNGGAFTAVTLPTWNQRLHFADLDGDGRAEIVAETMPVRIFHEQAGTIVEITQTGIPAAFTHHGLVVGDVDGDGDDDLVGDSLLRNDGVGGFTMEPLPLGQATATQLVDVDGDRDLDLVTTHGVLWNRERQLIVPLPPHTGRNLRVEVSSRPGRAANDIALLGVGLQSRAVGLPGPLGLLFVDNPLAILPVSIPNGTGLAELDLPVPAQPAIVGVALHLQTLHWNAAGLGFGNAVIARIE